MYSIYYYWNKILQKKMSKSKHYSTKTKKKFETRDNKKYKLKLIINSAVYGKETKS